MIENTSTRLKKIMNERHLRQVDLLELAKPFCKKYNVKMNKSDISQYLSGTVKPGQEKLAMLGMALNVNETWLMGYDVPMDRNKIVYSQPNNISTINPNLNQYIYDLGYKITNDKSKQNLLLETKKNKYEITLSDLKELESFTESFIKFKFSELINK